MVRVLAGVVLVVFVVGLFWLVARQNRRARAHWAAVAGRLGLSLKAGSLVKQTGLRGTIDGVELLVHSITRGGGKHTKIVTVVEARPAVPLPEGLRLDREGLGAKLLAKLGSQDIPLAHETLDGRVRVRGERPGAVQAVLDHPRATAALEAVADGSERTRLEDGRLILEKTGFLSTGLDTLIEAALAGARGLDDAVRAPWGAAADSWGLRHVETAEDATLEGEASGLPVRVHAAWRGEPVRTRISAGLVGGLPGGVRIVPGGDGPRLGDPVLDGRVVVEWVEGGGPEALDAALDWMRGRLAESGPDLRGCLLDVLHGIPGARIEDGVVSVELEGRVGPELEHLLERLIALARALSDRTEPSGFADPTPGSV